MSLGGGVVIWGTRGWRERRRAGPAFYALRPGGWRDLVTLLHPPYTAWHLSYVALGAAAAPEIHADRLLAALGAFFLAVGVGAHALDELHGRPLGTRLSDRALVALAVVGARRRGRRSASPGCSSSPPPSRRSWSSGAFLVARLQPRAVRRPLPHRLLVRRRLGRLPGADRLVGRTRSASTRPARRSPASR